jgi:hypothetical protein
LGDLELSEIAVEDLREFQTAVRQRPGRKGKPQVSDHTILAYHRVLSAFFNRLARLYCTIPGLQEKLGLEE